MSDNELGAFLRSRRDAITPAQAGLPAGPRRRAPGLRRAELAILAGVSVDYLTRLEQGRDRRPSAQVLSALADALQLSSAERVLLRNLAKTASGDFYCPVLEEPPAATVRPTVRALLERLEPAPAVLVNRLGDVLAWTTGYELLAEPLGVLSGDPPNLVRYHFTDPRARATYPEWHVVADALVANLKLDSGPDDAHAAALADELAVLAGSAFAARWAAPSTVGMRSGVQRMVHPDAGELRLAFETLELSDAHYQRILVYLPGDEPTSGALDRLTGLRPGSLHAVAG
ncbi:helix-turn-helix domain-containing protein [Jiangella rhizosphaerae]|uniref:Helix-turn-helix domain-containing protein n=1 Tax=Jiangella rhizosphaerae TaxID=2293569 RepID=A0A418KK03_9ACTN|nr:helix-turn-helix transcriptional regulator [Jiangella rhizosphaerae]RIQ15856.1 helix-turn-helix domain-containing protein [Jiangella rhizosphaerae]